MEKIPNVEENSSTREAEVVLADFQLMFEKNPDSLQVSDVMKRLDRTKNFEIDKSYTDNLSMLYTVGFARPDLLGVMEETVGEHLDDTQIRFLRAGADNAN